MKSELPVGWPFFVVFCRYMEYFKKLTSYPSVTYLGLQTDKVWAKSIFWPWPLFFNFPWFLLTFTLNHFQLVDLPTMLLLWVAWLISCPNFAWYEAYKRNVVKPRIKIETILPLPLVVKIILVLFKVIPSWTFKPAENKNTYSCGRKYKFIAKRM